jgi:hypothetical protein
MKSREQDGNVFEAPEEKLRMIAEGFGVKLGKRNGELETFARQLACAVSIQAPEKRQEFRKKWNLSDAFGEFPEGSPAPRRRHRLKAYTDLL